MLLDAAAQRATIRRAAMYVDKILKGIKAGEPSQDATLSDQAMSISVRYGMALRIASPTGECDSAHSTT